MNGWFCAARRLVPDRVLPMAQNVSTVTEVALDEDLIAEIDKHIERAWNQPNPHGTDLFAFAHTLHARYPERSEEHIRELLRGKFRAANLFWIGV